MGLAKTVEAFHGRLKSNPEFDDWIVAMDRKRQPDTVLFYGSTASGFMTLEMADDMLGRSDEEFFRIMRRMLIDRSPNPARPEK